MDIPELTGITYSIPVKIARWSKAYDVWSEKQKNNSKAEYELWRLFYWVLGVLIDSFTAISWPKESTEQEQLQA